MPDTPETKGQTRWVPTTRRASRPTSGISGGTGFLDNLWIEVIDEPYDNGVAGKHVIFHFEERSRVKVVDYEAVEDQVDISKIEETLDERNLRIRT